jgi:hypothetical protein
MIGLLKMQAYRNIRRPWFLLAFLLTFTLIVWFAVAPVRDFVSYQQFMDKYADMKPEFVSLSVLGEARFDLTVEEIYEEFIKLNQDWLFEESYSNTLGALTFLSFVIPAFFVARDISKKKIGNILVPGQSRAGVFIWLAVRYYIVAFLLTVAALGMVRIELCVDLSSFPHDWVVATQLRFVLFELAVFSGMMFLTFIVRRPLISAAVSLAFSIAAVLAVKGISSGSGALSQGAWLLSAEPGAGTVPIIASIAATVVFTAASYVIFRRTDA